MATRAPAAAALHCQALHPAHLQELQTHQAQHGLAPQRLAGAVAAVACAGAAAWLAAACRRPKPGSTRPLAGCPGATWACSTRCLRQVHQEPRGHQEEHRGGGAGAGGAA